MSSEPVSGKIGSSIFHLPHLTRSIQTGFWTRSKR